MDIGTQIVNSDLLKRFVKIDAIDLVDIVAYMEPIGYLKPEFFHAYQKGFETLSPPHKGSRYIKMMLNLFIGSLGKLKGTLSKIFTMSR